MGWGSKTESPAWLVMVTGVSLSAMIAARVAGVEGVITAWQPVGAHVQGGGEEVIRRPVHVPAQQQPGNIALIQPDHPGVRSACGRPGRGCR